MDIGHTTFSGDKRSDVKWTATIIIDSIVILNTHDTAQIPDVCSKSCSLVWRSGKWTAWNNAIALVPFSMMNLISSAIPIKWVKHSPQWSNTSAHCKSKQINNKSHIVLSCETRYVRTHLFHFTLYRTAIEFKRRFSFN